MGSEIKQIEEAQIELREGFVASAKQTFEMKEKDTGRLALIQTVTKYLDAKQLDIKKLKELRVVVKQKGAKKIGDKG